MTARETLEKELCSYFNLAQLEEVVRHALDEKLENLVAITSMPRTVFLLLNRLTQEEGKLIRFLEFILAPLSKPELRGAINTYYAEIFGVTTPKKDPFNELLVSGDPFVDRQEFRDMLRALFSDNSYQVMATRAPRYTGRSYSRILIRHIAGALDTEVIYLDLKGNTVEDLIWEIGNVMLLPANDLRDRLAQPSTKTKGFSSAFRGFKKDFSKSQQRCCLVFDHHDLNEVSPEVKEFAETLVRDAAENNLPNTWIILLGRGDWGFLKPDLRHKVMDVPVFELVASDVEKYLSELDKNYPRPLTPAELAQKKAKVLSDLNMITNLENMTEMFSRVRNYYYS